ncbi:MAG: helix-turn-helix transcriptional regulator [Polyangiales bacterium]
MSNQVLLLTDRRAFEDDWRRALDRVGLRAQAALPDPPSAAIHEGAVVVIDAGCGVFDEDELLAHVGLARALRVLCAVGLSDDERFRGIEDLLDDMCPGLLARSARDLPQVAATLARRADRERAKRFEYLAVSPRPSELIAILADGAAALLPRPVSEADDGSEVASISLGAGAESATLELASGQKVELRASSFAPSSSVRPSAAPSNGHASAIAIDGVRLGARLRELRVAAGLTQAELARRTGIHRPNIARVEAGRHTPSLETLARLASAIGVPTTLVLAEE